MHSEASKHKRFCPNCYHPRFRESKFCPDCGQKNTDGRLTFIEMMQEFSDAIFNFDSRIFNTIGALFLPGKLTEEYFKGRHKSYVHPLRLFIVTAIALIAAATYTLKDPDFMQMGRQLDKEKRKHYHHDFLVELDTIKDKTAESFQHRRVHEAMDSLFKKMSRGKKIELVDSIDVNKNLNFSEGEPFKIAFNDLLQLDSDSILNKYQVEGTWDRYRTKQQIELLKRGNNFGFFLIGNVVWMLLIMMPFLALILKLLYIRRGYFYVEHLIFSFHTHSFAFLIYIVMILWGYLMPPLIIPLGFITIAIYLFMAMRRVYQQSFWKTALKYILMNFFYIVILSTAAGITFLASFAMF